MLVLADSFLQRNGTALGLLATVLIGAIGWAVAWFIYAKGKRRKHLDYRIISDTPILSSSHKRPEELKVVYGPLEVQNPRVTEVRFWNTGNQVIDQSDFMEKPFRVLPRADARLLDFNVLERPTDLVEKLEQVDGGHEYDPGTLLVYPKTLNAGDSFTVQLVYDGGDSDRPPTVEGRVRDETRKPTIYQLPEARANKRQRVVISLLAFIPTVAVLVLAATHHLPTEVFVRITSVLALVAAFVAAVGGAFTASERRPRRRDRLSEP